MAVALEIAAGALVGRARFEAGQVVRVGSGHDADLFLPDASVAPLHCALQCGERAARLRDLGAPEGTFLNRQRVHEADVRHGDRIGAGQTTLAVSFAPALAERPPPVSLCAWEAPSAHDAPAHFAPLLASVPGPTFALLDAARGRDVLEIVRAAEDEAISLYTGGHAARLADWAPYMVPLSFRAERLEQLVQAGWSNRWCIFIASRHPIERILAHLRHLLMVDDEAGRTLYFRYYDPSVLRTFLPGCSEEQADLLFGAVEAILLEGPAPNVLLRVTRAPGHAARVAQGRR